MAKTNFPTTELGMWAGVIAACIAAMFLINLIAGCAILSEGAARVGIGYRSESSLFLVHEVDGDKAGNKAESRLEVDPDVLEGLLPETPKTESADEAGTGSEPPLTSD